MNSSLDSHHQKSISSGKSQTSLINPIGHFLSWSVFVEEAMSFFSRLSLKRPSVPAAPSPVTISDIDLRQSAGPFVAKEKFNRGADLVFFGDELYKWREEFNIQPAFIALRNIDCDEQVFSIPADLESSDLMVHWQFTFSQERK